MKAQFKKKISPIKLDINAWFLTWIVLKNKSWVRTEEWQKWWYSNEIQTPERTTRWHEGDWLFMNNGDWNVLVIAEGNVKFLPEAMCAMF